MVLLLQELTALSAAMVATIIVSAILFEAGRNNPRKGFLGLFLNGMMAVMFAGTTVYLYDHSYLEYAVAVNSVFMFLGVAAYLNGGRVSPTRAWSTVFGLSMVAGELLMGTSFSAALSGIGFLHSGLLNVFTASANSYWFLGPMAAEMSYILYLSRRRLGSPVRYYLLLMLPAMIISPALFQNSVYVKGAVWESSIMMIIVAIYSYEYLYANRMKKDQQTGITLELILIMLVMMLGEFLYFLYGSWTAFSFANSAAMFWFVYRALNPRGWASNYLVNAKWTFAFLVLTFVMEWFMGAALDFVMSVFPTGSGAFLSSIGFRPLTAGLSAFPAALFDFYIILSSVTGSSWFLIMMGTEMGSLVAFRIPQTKSMETRVRFTMMLFAYALYTIYAPYFSPIASSIGKIPFLGWSMGLGTFGPVAPTLLLGIVGTYLLSFVFSFMFGSRQICSLFCTAPLMYQGTFYDSLKVFNRTSRLGKKTLTSRLKPAFYAASAIVWGSLLAFAVLSYLDQTGRFGFTIYGLDPTVFLYGFYFNILWYVMFFAAPIVGSYACVTQGWCSWGTFNQLAGRVGLFRLKVKDRETCVKCETKDCAKACPVGLTDMPGSFISKGYFKSFKCVGVGDCVDACPYGNIYFYDFRNWVRSKFGRPELPPRREHPTVHA
ncbi:MAG: 4Fe-4S binding protein [Thermoprotei archaeon]